jgi:hypothetical protein
MGRIPQWGRGESLQGFSHKLSEGGSSTKYTCRKVVWDIVTKTGRFGAHVTSVAIDLIYEVYGGQTSVTDIINRLRKDKRNGTLNPNLRG